MATVDDIGVPGQPLSTPPLTAWQAAVRDRVKPADWGSGTNGSGMSGTVRVRTEVGTCLMAGALTGTITGSATIYTLPSYINPTFPPGSGITYFQFLLPPATSVAGASTVVRVWGNRAITVSTFTGTPGGVDLSSIRFPVL